ncbi:hypothetical protein PYCC9005_003740 [Savitreella phatthalungensis]
MSQPVQQIIPAQPNVPPASAVPAAFKRFSLEGKVAVVTGGARGLGYSMAQAICSCGLAGIAILDVLADVGDEAAAALNREFGIAAQFYKIDVRDEVAVSEVLAGVREQFGRVDVLICSAGICDNIKAEVYEAERFRRVMDINVTGSFLVAQACAKHMIELKTGGSIIFIASMSGHIVNYPQPQCAYNASKAAVIQLAKSLAAEWSPYGIRVNSISPGYMATKLTEAEHMRELKKTWAERTPLGRLGQDYELNGVAQFLASDASSFTTGADFLIDGGYTVM